MKRLTHLNQQLVCGVLILLTLMPASCAAQPTTTPQPTLTPTIPATPAPQMYNYAIDPAASVIDYLAIGAFNIQMPGTFKLFGNTILIVPENGKYRVKADVLIDGNSVTAINGIVRDALMNNLEVSKYPTARVILDSLELVEPDASGNLADTAVTLSGTLDLHGVTRNITIPVTLKITNGVLSAIGETKLDLLDHKVNVPTAIMNSTITFKANLKANLQ
ncbi:MAG: YceI family protein [Anaerolineae bacterium]|nr:YceI family protein [Anaerolineae bacterium]